MRYERPKTRSEWVYDLLKEKILSGQYEPLERLVADQIGRELGTSVIPIREALQRLESDGLVEIQPYVGARVAAISERDLEELFEIRKKLEPLLARSALAGVTPAALSELERIYTEMDQAIEADDMFAYSRKNWEFHESIYRLSPWRTLYQIVQQVCDNSARSRWVFNLAPHQSVESQVEHRQIIAALAEGDAETLYLLTTRQIERALDLYLDRIRETRRNLL
jgi:DNA-binding GntR family transcriptional regulator